MGKGLDTHFFKGDMQMANKPIKRCSTSLLIREVQIKITRDNFTPSRMIIIKKWKIRSVGMDVEKLEPSLCCWWEWKIVQPLWKIIRQFLQELNTE